MSGPEGWLPVEATLTLYVNPTADGIGRHEVIPPESIGTHRAWLTASQFEDRFGVPMPRVGPVGLSEEETRAWAREACGGEHCTSESAFHRGWDKFIRACRDAVAEWDAEGER